MARPGLNPNKRNFNKASKQAHQKTVNILRGTTSTKVKKK